MAELIFAAFGLFATFGYLCLATFVARRTGYRLSGWAAYLAIMALPAWLYIKGIGSLIAVLWERLS